MESWLMIARPRSQVYHTNGRLSGRVTISIGVDATA